MSTPRPPSPPRLKSLADFIVRHDLATVLHEARLDYQHSSAGGPRLLDQKDIAARFRKPRPLNPRPDEQR